MYAQGLLKALASEAIAGVGLSTARDTLMNNAPDPQLPPRDLAIQDVGPHCPHCGKRVAELLSFIFSLEEPPKECPHCRTPLAPKGAMKLLTGFGMKLLIAMVVGFTMGATGAENEGIQLKPLLYSAVALVILSAAVWLPLRAIAWFKGGFKIAEEISPPVGEEEN